MDALAKIQAMKKKKEMSPVEKDAKMGIVKEIQGLASKAMGDKLGNMKKVSVESNSPEGLKHGLAKANEVVDQLPDGGKLDEMAHEGSEEMASEHGDHEASETPEFEAGEEEGAEESPETEEEIDAMLKHLLMKKQALQHSKK